MGHLSGEDRRALVRKYRDTSNSSPGTARVLADEPTARRCRADRAAVGGSERSISLGQRRAGCRARRHSRRGHGALGWRGGWRRSGGGGCRRSGRRAGGRSATPRPAARQDQADRQGARRQGHSLIHGHDHTTLSFVGQGATAGHPVRARTTATLGRRPMIPPNFAWWSAAYRRKCSRLRPFERWSRPEPTDDRPAAHADLAHLSEKRVSP